MRAPHLHLKLLGLSSLCLWNIDHFRRKGKDRKGWGSLSSFTCETLLFPRCLGRWGFTRWLSLGFTAPEGTEWSCTAPGEGTGRAGPSQTLLRALRAVCQERLSRNATVSQQRSFWWVRKLFLSQVVLWEDCGKDGSFIAMLIQSCGLVLCS